MGGEGLGFTVANFTPNTSVPLGHRGRQHRERWTNVCGTITTDATGERY